MSTAEMEPLTSGASNRIIPILKTLRTSLVFVQTILISLLLLLFPRRRISPRMSSDSMPQSPTKSSKRRSLWRLEEEDTLRRRALAEGIDMADGDFQCRWGTYVFFGVRRNALFCRSWLPVTGELK